jgi:hypothetical protein
MTAGKKWALQQQSEEEEKRKKREAERVAEIAKAKETYLESLENSNLTVKQKEQAWLEEQERVQQIENHRQNLSRERGYGKDETEEKKEEKKEVRGMVPETGGLTLRYDQIKGNKNFYLYSDEYNCENLEVYLTDEEFLEVLEMDKATFYGMSKWKRGELLKKKDLF